MSALSTALPRVSGGMFLSLLLMAAMGAGACAADTTGWQLDSRSLARVEGSRSKPKVKKAKNGKAKADKAKAGKTRQVGGIACGSRVDAVAFGPTGTTLITQGDNQARVWNVRTGKPLSEPLPCASGKLGFIFSPDGKYFITSDDDQTLRVRDSATGEAIGEPMSHGGAVEVALFSPDGSRLATGAADGAVRMWNAHTTEPLAGDMRHDRAVTHLIFSPDGTRLLSGSQDNTTRLWNVRSGSIIGEPVRNVSPEQGLLISPDGTQYAVYIGRKELQRVDAKTGKPIGEPLKLGVLVYNASTAYSTDSSLLTTRGGLFDARTGKEVESADGKTFESSGRSFVYDPNGRIDLGIFDGLLCFVDARASEQAKERVRIGEPVRSCVGVNSVVRSPDGKLIAMIRGGDEEVHFALLPKSVDAVKPAKPKAPRWKVEAKKLPLDEKSIVAMSPDGTLYAAAKDKQAQLYEVRSGAAVGAAMVHEASVRRLAFSPDGKWVASVAGDHAVHLWEARSGKSAGVTLRHGENVKSMQFAPDGSVLATVGAEGTVRLWDVHTGKVRGESRMYGSPWVNMLFSPDGKCLVTGCGNTATHLWDTRSGKSVEIASKLPERGVAFSPDSKRIAFAEGKLVRLCDARTAQPVGEPMEHEKDVEVLAFGPNGKVLATCAGDGRVQLWDAQACKAKGKPMRHGGNRSAVSVAFSPDGKRLTVMLQYGMERRALYLWDVATRRCIGDTTGSMIFLAVHSPDGAFTAFGTEIWDADNFSKAELAEGSAVIDIAWSTLFSADCRTMIVHCAEGYFLLRLTKK